MVDERARHLLKALIESYISDGKPVGSRTLVEQLELSLSSATVRNIMADLEQLGLIRSPHTSAGRVPTARGYRFFVDSLIKVKPLQASAMARLSRNLDPDMGAQELVASASSLLSDITRMAGIVTLPRKETLNLRHVEFVPLSARRVLIILVLDDHEVQNRIIHTQREYSEIELRTAANFINDAYGGQPLKRVRSAIVKSMEADQASMNELMKTALSLANQVFDQPDESDYVVAGQENLVEIARTEALENLRDLFQAFTMKGDILHLLDRCMESQGLQLYIGDESGYRMLDEYSLVTAPYRIDGQMVGALCVIGPTRMAYDRVIPVVDATLVLAEAGLPYRFGA